VLGVIPARWASSRFPGKPLHPIAGKPLLQHVWERASRARGLARVIVATDDRRIAAAAAAIGAEVEMTRASHPSGTDRIAEVARRHPGFSHIINVQGDEPLISPRLIDRLARVLVADPRIPMITAANEFSSPADIENPDIVKVVLNKRGEALYFSRSVIPFQRREVSRLKFYRHKGIYGFRRDFLLRFVRWAPSVLELAEQLEQLRALENGASVRVIVTDDDSPGVDTPGQARTAGRLIRRIR
jgi:3-deoxy-manno-octulosonate cytidylyltransferase (CMP-KDO synthetase)